MQVHIPDPAYTSSERARASFRLAGKIALSFIAVLWVVQLLSGGMDLELARFGVRPRELAGLLGILLGPLLHGGYAHLMANSLPLLVLGTGMLYLYPNSALKVLPAVYLGPGVAVWLLAKAGTVHVGASGLVYGLFSYIFVAGLIRRDRRAIAASLLVFFLYGTSVWGVLPIRPGVSWETHLAAAVIGCALALALRHLDITPRKRYSWEDDSREERGVRSESEE
jgi:membrane associated rhomboid family serine protease